MGNEAGTIIDQLDYRYNKDASNHLVNNRLNYIYDPIPDGTSTYDVDGQSLNNYGYDAIGNLKSDVKERIGEIKWNVYGKNIENNPYSLQSSQKQIKNRNILF